MSNNQGVIEVTFFQKAGQVSCEPIQGYITLNLKDRIVLKNLHISCGARFRSGKTKKTDKQKRPIYEIDTDVGTPLSFNIPRDFGMYSFDWDKEMYPGVYKFDFNFIPKPFNNPPFDVKDDCHLKYYLTVDVIHSTKIGVEHIIYQKEFKPLFVIGNIQPKPNKVVLSGNKVDYDISISNTEVCIGDTVNVSGRVLNNTKYKCRVSVGTVVRFDGTNVVYESPKNVITTIQPNTMTNGFNFAHVIDIHTPTTMTVGNLKSNVYVCVYSDLMSGEKVKDTDRQEIPINLYCTTTDISFMDQIAREYGVPRDFTTEEPYVGYRGGEPPAYQSIESIKRPYVQEFRGVDGALYYADHFNKKCFDDIDCTKPARYDYPFIYSYALPPDWSYGYYKNQIYYIDHRNQITTWYDPRTIVPEDGIPQKPPQTSTIYELYVEFVECRNLPLFTHSSSKEPVYYFAAMDKDEQFVKTASVKNGVDPIFCFEKHNKLSIKLQTNIANCIIGCYQKNAVGGVALVGIIDINLSLFPYGRLMDMWFSLSNNGDDSKPTTGSVRAKVAFKQAGVKVESLPKIKIRMAPYAYMPLTELLQSEVADQVAYRKKKKISESTLVINGDEYITDYTMKVQRKGKKQLAQSILSMPVTQDEPTSNLN